MKFGVLADLFEGAGAKALTEVEINRQRSNQHEFQGVSGFRAFLGTPAEKQTFPAIFYWLEDDEDAEPMQLESFCTWSDVRRGQARRSPEYHLYYAAESEPVVHQARAGDQVVIARTKDGSLMVLLTPEGSTIGQQLLWLFGLDLFEGRSAARRLDRDDTIELGFAARSILADLGIETEEPEPDAFDLLIEKFGRAFPGTVPLSVFARETLSEVDPLEDPDGALVAWMEHEEALFRHLEREIVSDRLKAGFTEQGSADVDGFLSFSLSVQNRRKSRAGYAFGHHVEAILQAHGVSYTREATTEKRNAADFLFPGEDEYADRRYPDHQLAMLAVKTSCKDRWRQVLAEADRIRTKHLLTLEPAISKVQTAEMQGHGLQLVLPVSLHSTYQADQRAWLISVGDFLDLIRDLRGRQRLLI
ncbi:MULTISPECIES: type II restriction endonuclease [unclassified Ruegeria]|uniref:type II restriction endonuclease n=1 Tax=unclassified Ruegeria TaxID=2625375 RepID=UPI0014817ED8|nr:MULTISPECIES: type II restriction endonuclease [unclassified Ruegeria]NOD62038.1 type II restriction endonuclease [Ruegeria sp. HKCCD6109]